jgi:Holliday junction resolvase RusA-like endonuclease
MSAIAFTVFGKPSPSGSKKAFQHSKTGRIVVVDTAKGKAKWQTLCKRAATTAVKESGWGCASGPINLQVLFTFARPKAHFRTGKNSGIMKPTAPFWHTQKPDRTKLLRCLEDAFKGVLWKDDSQVISGEARKCWGDEDSAFVIVETVEQPNEIQAS